MKKTNPTTEIEMYTDSKATSPSSIATFDKFFEYTPGDDNCPLRTCEVRQKDCKASIDETYPSSSFKTGAAATVSSYSVNAMKNKGLSTSVCAYCFIKKGRTGTEYPVSQVFSINIIDCSKRVTLVKDFTGIFKTNYEPNGKGAVIVKGLSDIVTHSNADKKCDINECALYETGCQNKLSRSSAITMAKKSPYPIVMQNKESKGANVKFCIKCSFEGAATFTQELKAIQQADCS